MAVTKEPGYNHVLSHFRMVGLLVSLHPSQGRTVGDICLSVCLSVCMSVCLFVEAFTDNRLHPPEPL